MHAGKFSATNIRHAPTICFHDKPTRRGGDWLASATPANTIGVKMRGFRTKFSGLRPQIGHFARVYRTGLSRLMSLSPRRCDPPRKPPASTNRADAQEPSCWPHSKRAASRVRQRNGRPDSGRKRRETSCKARWETIRDPLARRAAPPESSWHRLRQTAPRP